MYKNRIEQYVREITDLKKEFEELKEGKENTD
jgi:hypothetical protein